MKRIILAILCLLAVVAGYMVYIRYVDTSVISIGITTDPSMQQIYAAALKTDGKGRITVLGEHTAPLDESVKWLLEAQAKGIQALETTPNSCVGAYHQIISQLIQKLGLKPNAVHVIGTDRCGKMLNEKISIITVDSIGEEERRGRLYVQGLLNQPIVILTCDVGATMTVMRKSQIQHMSFGTVDDMINNVHKIEGQVPLNWVLLGNSWQNPVLRHHVTNTLKQKVSTSIEVKSLAELGYNSATLPAQILAYLAVRRLQKLPLSGTSSAKSAITGCIYQPKPAEPQR